MCSEMTLHHLISSNKFNIHIPVSSWSLFATNYHDKTESVGTDDRLDSKLSAAAYLYNLCFQSNKDQLTKEVRYYRTAHILSFEPCAQDEFIFCGYK